MKQIQVNGQTYVNAEDCADWLVEDNDKVKEIEPAMAEAAEILARLLRNWSRDPERKHGIQNIIV